MVRALLISAALVVSCAAVHAQEASSVEAEAYSPAPIVISLKAEEARQGVASDGTYVYAIDNDRIGKYAIASGRRVAQWSGEGELFPHMNSCTVVGEELVCAVSNYPQVPHTSAVEIFSTEPLAHKRTISLGFGPGSLTALDRHNGTWWAVFANYDRRGGVDGRGHEYTMLVKLDDNFQELEGWAFPADVLARFAPYSCSGMSWGDDGRIYVTGHDRPEVYALTLPQAGSTLRLVGIYDMPTNGQAIDWDPVVSGRLWSISRKNGTVIATFVQH